MESIAKVSAVMCTYNGEKYLCEQIESILCQTFPVYELIIQDDCSTDKTVEIIKKYQERDSRIKLYINPRPLGFCFNFSTAYLKASGEYIASADQDDIWRKDKIEVLLKNIGNNALIFHNSCLFYNSPDEIVRLRYSDKVMCNELHLLLKPFIAGHGCLFRHEILPDFQEVMNKAQHACYDYLLAIVAQTSGGITYSNEGLIYWRRHPQAASYSPGKKLYSPSLGLLLALKALGNRSRREGSRKYFNALSSLPFQEKDSAAIVRLMAKGKLVDIFRACLITFSKRKSLYPCVSPIQSCIKSFFTPIYFIRDDYSAL